MNSSLNLRILSVKKETFVYTNVIEYVQGRQCFYVNLGNRVAKHPRDSIRQIFRFNKEREWPVNLKQWRSEND